jgi:hypothetical protein
MGLPFDSITWTFEQHLTNELREQIYRDHVKDVDAYLAMCVGANQEKTLEALLAAMTKLDEDLATVCALHSADQWLSLVRRIPPIVFEEAWTVHATLAILKHSSWEKDSTLGRVEGNGQYGVALLYTPEDMQHAWRIAVLSGLLARLLVWRRGCSKGARITTSTSGFQTTTSQRVSDAIGHYERRRPQEWIFGDEATPISAVSDDSRDVLHLAPAAKPIPLAVRRGNFTLFLAHAPRIVSFESLKRTLRFYDEPLRDRFGAGADALLHVLCALTVNIDRTLLPLETRDYGFYTEADTSNDPEARHKLKFTFDLLQRGYVRFPRKRLSEALSNIRIAGVEGEPEELVCAFLDAWMMKPDQRNNIDVVAIESTPFAFETPGQNCYLDLTLFDDFVRGLLESARDWYSVAHGDRFNLFVKNLIDEKTRNARVIGWKTALTTTAGKTKIPDLLIESRDVLYAVECKAYSKSRAFWRGDLDAVRQRAAGVAESVKQAREAAEVVQTVVAEKTLQTKAKRVEWLVCGSTQEFLAPLDKYGMLDAKAGIPRVCTHEELVAFLARR